MWLDYVLWFGSLSGMETTDVGYVYLLDYVVVGQVMDVCGGMCITKNLVYEQYSLLI
ncbi:putative basic proline-rich protein-like [Iris pallida]|uniref:Basic proline-rich protein-like n=1 Tax=Iris pallida TaxID=29817 RepID=A0AAX6I4D7_IRIPA|nr:putative basic proline-rich protein-like [Iris pallida]